MNRIIGLILAGFLAVSAQAADTYTSRMGLTKPEVGSTGWGPKVNTDYDIIDTSAAVLAKENDFTAHMEIRNSSLSLTGSNGYITSPSSVNASGFFGNGSSLSGVATTGKETDFTAHVEIRNSSLTMTGAGGYITTPSSVNASGFFGNGAGLSGIPYANLVATNTVADGTTGSVQYNQSGYLRGDSKLTWSPSSYLLQVIGPLLGSGNGKWYADSSSDGNPKSVLQTTNGSLSITKHDAGNSDITESGGSVIISGTFSSITGVATLGPDMSIVAGSIGAQNVPARTVTITAGDGNSQPQNGGAVTITAGAGTVGATGSKIILNGGKANPAGVGGRLDLIGGNGVIGGTVAVTTNGTEVAVFTSSGVGISSPTPHNALDVGGNINARGYKTGEVPGVSTQCAAGYVLSSTTVNGGIVTAGTCRDLPFVNKAGDTMTGSLTILNSSMTVTYNISAGSAAFSSGITAASGTFTSSGAAQYSITASSGINAGTGPVVAQYFVGSGVGLTNICMSSATFVQNTSFSNTVYGVAIASVTINTRGYPVQVVFNGMVLGSAGNPNAFASVLVDGNFGVDVGSKTLSGARFAGSTDVLSMDYNVMLNTVAAGSHTFGLMVRTTTNTQTVLNDGTRTSQFYVRECP